MKSLRWLAVFAACVSLRAGEVRVGYSDAPPLSWRGEGGKPAGFVVEAIGEAARERAVNVRWVFVRGDAEAALARGEIDLWPTASPTEQRRRRYFLSTPWWSSEAVFLVRDDRGLETVDSLRGRTTVYRPSPALEALARRELAGVRLLAHENAREAAAMVCRGWVEAFLAHQTTVQGLLLERPEACAGVNLRLITWPGGVLPLTLMAIRHKEQEAAALRNGLDQLIVEGRLTGIAARSTPSAVANAEQLAWAARGKSEGRLLFVLLAGAVCLLAVSGFFILRLRSAIQRRRAVEESLQQKARQLANSNEHLQQFAFAAAHDLQEPLRNVRLFSEMLEHKYKGRLDSQADEYLGFIVDGTARMQTLVSDLLTYMHATEGALEGQNADAGTVLDNVRQNLTSAIAEAGARIVVEKPLPHVAVHPSHLEQVLQNLIGNALKYRGTAPPRIEVAAERVGERWRFSVRDNGIGIEPQYHDRIFGVFKRLHGQEIPGSGIGLAICARIIANYGGRIHVESQPGAGSTFVFTVPAVKAARARAAAAL